jgi:hypothetical protein
MAAAAVGSGALAAARFPALAFGAAPEAIDFSLPIASAAFRRAGEVRAAGGPDSGGHLLVSRTLQTPRRFDLVGLRWEGGARPRPEVRTRRAGGRWSPWIEAQGAGHGPDGEAPPSGTEPVWVGGADALQIRLSEPVEGLRAHFVNSTGTATTLGRARSAIRSAAAPAGARQAAAGPPRIIPRSAWGANQLAPRKGPSYGVVQLAFVHHTVTANAYRPGDSAAMVLGIYRYHRNANGWDDIGYNFLVDRYGQVFEGRAGGVNQAVIGAQAQGYNAVSTGVASLGTFSSQRQSARGVRSLARLIAWKLALHGVPLIGSVTVPSSGGTTNRYPAGTAVTFQRISGHRDGDTTECPGSALYAQLPGLRALASRYAR